MDKEVTASNETFWGSDVMASALRELDIPYACLNPGASYRGLHDSIVNFLGNERPQMILHLHEEHAAAMAQGYAKASGDPLIVIVHSNVGLLHATMAIFNAYVDRVPMIVIGATGPLDAAKRRPHIDWIHTCQDQASVIRDYVKWDDQPGSPEAAVESIRRGKMIACTPPYGPVYINLDSAVQESQLETWPEFNDASRYTPPSPPGAPKKELQEAADLLLGAKHPLMLCGRIQRTEQAWNDRIKLAELLGAKAIVNSWQEIGFPSTHPLSVGMSGFHVSGIFRDAHEEADVVLGLDWFDLGGTMNSAWNNGIVKPKVIHASMDFHQHRGWLKDHGVLPPVDVAVSTTPEVFISELLPIIEKSVEHKPYVIARPEPREVGESGPIGIRDLARTFRNVTLDLKVCTISTTIGWSHNESVFDHPLAYLGTAGGGGLGAGPGNAVGTALALRDMKSDAIPVAILGDGDTLMGIQALWPAVVEGIPLLIIVGNNHSYFNDELHQENVAKKRGRPPENRWIGQRIAGPEPDLVGLAKAQGWETIGPISDLADLAEAISDGLARVQGGACILLDAHIIGEYAPTPEHDRKTG